MDNLTKYSPAILNNNGNLEASMCVTNIGEYVKLSDIKELLNSSHNNARDEICADIIESNTVCDYCQRTVGAKVACSFSVQDFSCFRGRKLSPIA